MDNESSSEEAPSMERNSKIEDTCSSRSHTSESDDVIPAYNSSGDKAAM